MRLGYNEKIILSLIQKYQIYDEKKLDILFLSIIKKKARVDLILFSLHIKNILDKKTNRLLIPLDEFQLPEIIVKPEILENLEYLTFSIKLGKLAKILLYVIYRTEKCSLQFLASFLNKPVNNIYAILQRLEEKEFIISHHSRIKHYGSTGRKFNPKYYVLTDLGKIWFLIFGIPNIDIEKIDKAVSNIEKQRKKLVFDF